jgi:isocitrate dehydrogenase kinase/phosphatase
VHEALMGLFDHGHLRANFQIQVLSSLFYRNKGAYVVGKVINGFQECRSHCPSCMRPRASW